MRHACRAIGVALVIVVLSASPARAAELTKNSFELGLSALLQDTENSGFYLNIATRVGWMITPNHEVGPVMSFLYVKPDNSRSISASSLGAFYRYNFSTTNKYLIPFTGLAATGYTGDLANSLQWSWQAEAGIRILVSPKACINNVLFWHRDYKKAWWVTSERYFGLSVGFSLFL